MFTYLIMTKERYRTHKDALSVASKMDFENAMYLDWLTGVCATSGPQVGHG